MMAPYWDNLGIIGYIVSVLICWILDGFVIKTDPKPLSQPLFARDLFDFVPQGILSGDSLARFSFVLDYFVIIAGAFVVSKLVFGGPFGIRLRDRTPDSHKHPRRRGLFPPCAQSSPPGPGRSLPKVFSRFIDFDPCRISDAFLKGASPTWIPAAVYCPNMEPTQPKS